MAHSGRVDWNLDASRNRLATTTRAGMQVVPMGRAQDPSSESDPVKQLETRQNLIPRCLEQRSERRAELEWCWLLAA